jgi:hypothetical protein
MVDSMNRTLAPRQTIPAPADQPDLGVADWAVNATRVCGNGDAEVRALDNVTVDFATSRFTAIMGPSGSGKSTLMHAPGGLDSLRRLFAVAAAALTGVRNLRPSVPAPRQLRCQAGPAGETSLRALGADFRQSWPNDVLVAWIGSQSLGGRDGSLP